MESIKIEVTDNIAKVTSRPVRITSGTIGLPVEFTFDSNWDGLTKSAVFQAGCVTKTRGLPGTETTVPWEVLTKPDLWLTIGVFGVNADGTEAIPTVWATVAVICAGAKPSGDPSLDPTLPVWQELQNAVAGLDGRIDGVENLAVKGSANHNLLDNSDFRNPVNQRGSITVQVPTTDRTTYTIDRWFLKPGRCWFDVYPEGVRITSEEYLGSIDFCQKIPYTKGYGKFTFAVCTTDDEVIVASGEFSPSKTALFSDTYDWGCLCVRYDHSEQTINVEVILYNYKSIFLKWTALYEGEYTVETLPKYQPKGYGVEMAECLRYFYRFPNKNNANHPVFGIGVCHKATRVGLPFRLPVPMRIDTPSVTPVGSFSLSTNWQNKLGVTSISFSERSTDVVVLLVDVASGLTPGGTYVLQGLNDKTAHIDFSADL